MKALFMAAFDFFLRYVVLMVLLLSALGVHLLLQAAGTSEAVSGAAAVVVLVGGALFVVIGSRRSARTRSETRATDRV